MSYLLGVDWSKPHPDTEAETFIQWKGTDVCIDIRCPCGNGPHIDGMFAYFVRCNCGKVYQLGYQLQLRSVTEEELAESKIEEGLIQTGSADDTNLVSFEIPGE